MKKIVKSTQDMRLFTCPQCEKRRMTRPIDHVVSIEKKEYKSKDGTIVSLMHDICDYCVKRNYQTYFEPTKADIKKIINAIKTEGNISENQSIEDLL